MRVEDTSSDDGMAKFEGGGQRSSDEGKPAFVQLLLTDVSYEDQPLTQAALRMREGAALYGARNHEKMQDQEALERCYDSLLRHAFQLGDAVFAGGDESVMDESHVAAVIANTVMLAGIMRRVQRADD